MPKNYRKIVKDLIGNMTRIRVDNTHSKEDVIAARTWLLRELCMKKNEAEFEPWVVDYLDNVEEILKRPKLDFIEGDTAYLNFHKKKKSVQTKVVSVNDHYTPARYEVKCMSKYYPCTKDGVLTKRPAYQVATEMDELELILPQPKSDQQGNRFAN